MLVAEATANLHSTMYLFQLMQQEQTISSHSDLHSTMYLFQRFTAAWVGGACAHLHSTMYLFQQLPNVPQYLVYI